MVASENHIIYKYSTEIEFKNVKKDYFLQNKIATIIKDRILPAIENLFDEEGLKGKRIKIESLKLDVGNINNKAWEDNLLTETIFKLRKQLNKIISFNSSSEVYEIVYENNEAVVNNIAIADEHINNLLEFIKTGLLGWNTSVSSAKQILHFVIERSANTELQASQKEKLIHAIFYSEETFKRFLLQFTDEELLNFFDLVLQFKNIRSEFLIPVKQFQYNEEQYKLKIAKWVSLLSHFRSEIPNNNILALVLKKNIDEEKPVINDIQKNRFLKKKNEITGKEYFINNAGLVLIANFLQQLFINLRLSNKKEFLSVEKQMRAVILVQYLITGQTEIAEHDLLLNKIVCGYPLQNTLPNVFIPTHEEQKQCEELLQSVLEHWKELKSSNTQALCNTYILRQGKINDNTEYWQLQVESKMVDVMLGFLPWSIGIIYLPWMEKRLMVDWHS